MTISWASSDGQTGIAEDAYEFAMQHQGKQDRQELPPQERINQAFGEGPTPELKDQNAPASWGMDEEMKSLGTLPDAPADEWDKAYGPGRTMHEQLASFQKRLDATPPAEAGALQKFFGSLNIMPAPGKPQEEWTAKEHLGYMLNTAMGGMGGGYRMPKVTGPGFGARPPASFDYPMDFKDYYPANNANRKGGVTFREGEPLTTETIPQLQQAQDRRVNWPEGWGTTKATGRALTEYPHVQKAFKEAVESGAGSISEITDHMNLNGVTINPSTVQLLRKQAGLTGVKAEAWSEDKHNTFMNLIKEGKTTPEIAKEMGITRSTVEGKIRRVREDDPDFERTFIARDTMADRLKSVSELADQGLHASAIAEKIGKSPAYVRMLASTGNIELPRDPKSRGGGAPRKIEKGDWQKALQERLNR